MLWELAVVVWQLVGFKVLHFDLNHPWIILMAASVRRQELYQPLTFSIPCRVLPGW